MKFQCVCVCDCFSNQNLKQILLFLSNETFFLQIEISSGDVLQQKAEAELTFSIKQDLASSKVVAIKCTNKQENINLNCKKQSAEAMISWSSLPPSLVKPGKVHFHYCTNFN